MQFIKSILILFILSISFFSCNDDDPIIPNEEELITTVIYTLTPVGGGDDVVFSFTDLDGDGPNAPVLVEGNLAANTTYEGTIEFLNEVETPAEDITEEVVEEGDEHQVFYIQTGSSASVAYDDEDDNGNPLGVLTTLETGDASTGTLIITLRHEPKKPNNGTLADAGGETDVQVTFDITIQ